ncbi:MAG: family 10 glycosylhydrolase [Kiritimatiellae bacterium]|nr:family 10 glycosylhydrolase [Kiritimatiellia bacterium]MDD5522365.1 family 10 glycosylhydrolase [Kiritimatiellia bacterium]
MKNILSILGVTIFPAVLILGQDGMLEIKGMGSEGKKPYQGGKVEFLEVSIADQIVHFTKPENIPLRLSIRYNVLETAPVLLNSRLGTEHWHLYQYDKNALSALHTREKIDLSKAGEATTTVKDARAVSQYGLLLAKGLVGIRGHYYFLVDQPDGKWLDVVNPPAFFNRPELIQKLVFTLANLEKFSLELSAIESTWRPNSLVRVKLVLTDADASKFPVVNAKTTAEAGDWKTTLETEMDDMNIPTGWMVTKLPEKEVPDKMLVHMTVNAMTPTGPVTQVVTRTFSKGDGQKTETEMGAKAGPVVLPRNANGIVHETRALWMNPNSYMTKKDIETVVERADAARLNMIVADIFVRSMLIAKSELFPMHSKVEEGFDPLACLIEKAHEKGIEVHPWFCVTYRDANFRKKLPGVDVINKNGKVEELPADAHRPEYRDFIVKLMVGVARDYNVDGIHLDYIRTMGKCYCEKCKEEFQRQFGKPLIEATDEDWIKWQQEAIGDIVRRTAEGVKTVKPKAMMSAAVFSNLRGGAMEGQDPAGWAKKGWIDIIMPMDYKMDTLAMRATEKEFLDALDNDNKLVTGLSLYVRSGAKAQDRSPMLVKQQIQMVRRLGIHGYCLFEFTYLSDEIIKMMKSELNQEKAVPFFR